MNAGAYGCSTAPLMRSLDVFTPEKGLHTLAEVRAENAREQSKPKKNTTGGNAWMKEYLNQ